MTAMNRKMLRCEPSGGTSKPDHDWFSGSQLRLGVVVLGWSKQREEGYHA